MDEVDPDTIYLDPELREFPESLLLSAPVEFLVSATATLKGSIRNLGLLVSKEIDSNSA